MMQPIALIGTMCLFFHGGLSQQDCYNVRISSRDIQATVNAHNQLRNQVTTGHPQLWDRHGSPLPRAQNMATLKWDPNLALAAGVMTQTCSFGHSIENVQPYLQSGQNIYQGWTTDQTKCPLTDAVNLWGSEIKIYKNSQRRPFADSDSTDPKKSTGHFSQLIWAQTTNVGCACSVNSQGQSGLWQVLIACNYGNGGNVTPQGMDISIYDAVGEAASVNQSTLDFGPQTMMANQNQNGQNPNNQYNQNQNGQNPNNQYNQNQPQPNTNNGYYQNQPQQNTNNGYYQNQPQPNTNNGYYQNQPQPNTNNGYYQNQPQPNTNNGYYQNQPQPNTNNGYYQNQPPQNTNNGYNQNQPQYQNSLSGDQYGN